jgi:hypothetical protein
MTEPAEARPRDVQFVLAWHADEDRGLIGELRVRNISATSVMLGGKPAIQPLRTDGVPLDARTAMTLEFRPPGYVEIEPGEEAVAPVGWAGWNGPPASGDVLVQWPGGTSRVTVSGPHQPEASGPRTTLRSSWFNRLGSPDS